MREFDLGILFFLNQFAGQWPKFDRIFSVFLQRDFVKFLPFVACLVWMWFSENRQPKRRHIVASTVFACFLALAISRLIQNFSPARPRPLHALDLTLTLPDGITRDWLAGWSSFPSDTTAFVFAMATGIWLMSRSAGLVAFAWAAAMGSTRVYLLLHYPSDIIAGAVLGITATLICVGVTAFSSHRYEILEQDPKYRPFFYAFFFVVLDQFGNGFNELIESAKTAVKLLGGLPSF